MLAMDREKKATMLDFSELMSQSSAHGHRSGSQPTASFRLIGSAQA